MKKICFAGAFVALAGLFYLLFFNYTEAYEVGMVRDVISGDVLLQEKGGFHLSAPWVQISRIDTRPMRVCITSRTRAVFNCKLVEFEPKAYREFVAVEGWRYYWMSNRFSINLGYLEEYRGMRDILRGYAFSVKQYPFLRVLRDYDQ